MSAFGQRQACAVHLSAKGQKRTFQLEQGMFNRLATAQSTMAMRHWWPAAIVTLGAVVALTALTADALATQARPAPSAEATAPRAAGEPIMAIVSIKTQQVTFYDADG